MPASIFGERFMGRREPAWHGLGTTFDQDLKLSPSAGILLSGCDYTVQKYPLTVNLPDGTKMASDRVALVREPIQGEGSYHVLGYASDSYEVVQNLEIGFMIDELGERWPLETVGALGEGETVFIALDAGIAMIAGEEIHNYFTISNSHTGGRSMKIMLTPVRTVCQNTLIAAMQQASVMASLPHTFNVKDDATFHVNLIAQLQQQQHLLFESFEQMAKAKLVKAQIEEILVAAYPDPKPPRRKMVGDIMVKDPAMMAMLQDNKELAKQAMGQINRATVDFEYAVKRATQFRDGARECMEKANEENPALANTAWMAWQGVTECENYRNGDKKNPASTGESILFGERAQAMGRAYTKALELASA